MKPGLKIIDMECSVPYGAEHEKTAAAAAPPAAAGQPGYGMANYGRIFRSRSEGNDPRPKTDLDAYMKHLAGLGIVRSVPFGVSNEEATALLRRYPGRFLGLARISVNTHRGMAGVRELERLVRDEGFSALGVSALVDCLPASDRRYYPLYTKAAELGVGDADAVRQHADPGQSAGRPLGRARGAAVRDADRRVPRPAAQGLGEGEVALRQCGARLRDRVRRPQ